jgi:hypothetical protein
MPNEDQEITRGNNAAALLGNPLLQEAFEAIKQRQRNAIENSQFSAAPLREAAYRMLCAVKEVETHLTTFVNTGKMAAVARAARDDAEDRERRIDAWDGSADGQPTGTA